jgi:hypothetical protein
MLLLLAACTEAPDMPAPRFRVSSVSPEDGATDVVEAMIPELRFSDPIDEATCTPETLRLDAIHADGTVAFPVDVSVSALDDGFRVQLRHDEAPLPVGWTYAISARAGDEDGCLSVDGALLSPFGSTFTVAP